ncbi:GNAT family N-acetyltransferase [Actinoplanes couchii]|uniref:Aminoglycoside N-acetyltransferase AAC(2')-Ie n=1 Tax=Actinoplanes couchii TaxID=403638 RepID=A0ABQ3X1A5_9ACTN|nr:GNAT family N-acetyltransferase [Actinoplanes couchii]MDR6316686.1 aminoglycoside 2'-N-acetyltransferase I [Actinoplanes couchii]GID52295.1 aminoglycoside N-acetyltransferase AAC(2')-Ie [Actinoplanes couchii]
MGRSGAVRTAPTADLIRAELSAIRDLLDLAFDGRFDDHDWDHALGGLHTLIVQDGVLVAHGSVVQRRFLLDGRTLRCGYVEAVAVHPEFRGRGLAAAVMGEAERLIDGGYDLGALSASESGRGLYLARGWRLWPGPTAVLSPTGVVRTPEDDDSTLVRMTGALDGGTLVCDWRDGDVW